jgi:ribosomal protein S7
MKKIQNIYTKFVNLLIKKGKKTKSKKIIDNSLLILSSMLSLPHFVLLNTLFLKLSVFIETRTVLFRRSRFIVPFPTTFSRKMYLVIKWFILVLKKNKKKNSFDKKLIKELFLVLDENSSSEVLKLKNLNISKALKNRSNLHYRW